MMAFVLVLEPKDPARPLLVLGGYQSFHEADAAGALACGFEFLALTTTRHRFPNKGRERPDDWIFANYGVFPAATAKPVQR